VIRQGRRFALDFGSARIGIAVCDREGILAVPVATLSNNEEAISAFLGLIDGDVLEIYVGLPLNLSGERTQSTNNALNFARTLSQLIQIPVRLIDERLTTSQANHQLREVGKSQKQGRGSIDQMAAVAILEYALNMERNTGKPTGIEIKEWLEEND